MDLQTLEWFPYGRRYWYPHMAPLDVAIWERFLDSNTDIFDFVAYDVAIGDGIGAEAIAAAGLPPASNRPYQRKIDVLGKKNNMLFIVEVKPRASTAAIGQVKGYVTLFKRDFNIGSAVLPIIATDELLPEMEFLAKQEGVTLILA